MRRGRPLHVSWSDTESELAARLGGEREYRRRQRLKALLMLRQGYRLGEVSESVGVHYRTIQRWVEWYQSDGIDSVLRRTPGYNAQGQRSKLTDDQVHELLTACQKGAIRSIGEAVDWVDNRFGVRFAYSGMANLLRRYRQRRTTGDHTDATQRQATGHRGGSSIARAPAPEAW